MHIHALIVCNPYKYAIYGTFTAHDFPKSSRIFLFPHSYFSMSLCLYVFIFLFHFAKTGRNEEVVIKFASIN